MDIFDSMDVEFESSWETLKVQLERQFNTPLDLDGVLFLIGIQELGQGYKELSKDEKVDIMHIAICRLLADYGYYKYKGRDEEGWPHWELDKTLPILSTTEQETLMMKAILNYFGPN